MRSAIADSGATCYALAGAAGIAESGVRKFVTRERSLSLDSGARLAEALGLKIVRPSKPRRFPGRVPSAGPAPAPPDPATQDAIEASVDDEPAIS